MSIFDLQQRDKALVQATDVSKVLFDKQPVSLKDTITEEVEAFSVDPQDWLEIFEEDQVQIEFCQ